MSVSQSLYLKLLGITQWQLRSVKPAIKSYHYHYILRTHTGRDDSFVILLADAKNFDAPEQQLVSAMVKATKLSFEGGLKEDSIFNIKSDAKLKAVILLGEKVAKLLLGNREALSRAGKIQQLGEWPVMMSYSPDALLQEPKLKALVWQDLQLVMRLLQSN